MRRSYRILNLTVVSVLLFAFSLTATAQAPNEKRPPAPTTLQMMPGADRPGSDPLQLLQVKEVQQELGLTKDQIAKLEKIAQKYRPQVNQSSRGSTQEQKIFLQRNVDESRQEVAKVLKPKQIDRFSQIVLQVNGWNPEPLVSRTRGTTSNAPQDPLKLTLDQQKKLSGIQGETEQEMINTLQAFRTRGASAAELCQKMDQLREQRNQQMLSTLSEEQRAALEKLKGKPFVLPPRDCTQ